MTDKKRKAVPTEDELWTEAYKPVREMLREVETRLQKIESIEALAQFMAAFPKREIVHDAENYILRSGGKRLRAALCMLSANVCGAPARSALPLAVGVELFHAATLVVDDLIEDADLRRGRPATHKLWGDPGAMAAAFGLQLRALPAFLQTIRATLNSGDPRNTSRLVAQIGQTVARVVWGETLQHRMRMKYDLAEDIYFHIIGDKTASMFELCCVGGALVAGADSAEQDALKKYGMRLGLAFQIADDALDLEGEIKKLGKSPGSDLKEGRATLPLIYYFRETNDRQRKFMAKMLPPLRKPPLPKDEIVAELNKAGALMKCRKTAVAQAAKARRALSKIPDGQARQSLQILAALSAQRSR